MRCAKIISNDENNGRIVSALEVKEGLVDSHYDFIDVEEEFRVTYVKAAKCQGAAYFRLYWSYEEYQAFSQEKKERYDIVKEMRHFQDGLWHRGWEEKVRQFAEIEKYIRNDYGKCKRADAFVSENKLVIEFQHSYIAGDFQSRNSFYSDLDYKVIWLFDVMQHEIVYEEGKYYILEDNARGLFRVINTNDDLSEYNVYAQAKDGKIYRITKLYRKEISKDNLSTIRYFNTDEVYTEEEFINFLMSTSELRTLYEICKCAANSMVVFNTETGQYLKFYKDKSTGKMTRQFDTGCIGYRYVKQDLRTGCFYVSYQKFYSLKECKARKAIWKVVNIY